jgi:TRAP-type C4-dicarboxylate transport system substrate-binding protein
MNRSRYSLLLAAVGSVLMLGGGGSVSAEVLIKLGTLAPEGSIWHDALLETRQQWRDLSAGEVELRIYAGGVLGGESEMIRKMQRRGLDALAISGSGLPLMDSVMDCLNLPLLFNSYDELERVRAAVSAELENSFLAKGYVVLNWAEAGWVHFFAKSPVRTPDDLRGLRVWISTGAPDTERVFKQLGFHVVPLPATDMLTGLQTGLIEVIDVPPLFSLLDRSYQVASYMTDLKFAPLNAATVITKPAWERIPAVYHSDLLAAIRATGRRLRAEIRRAEEDAVTEMVSRGLTVVRLDPASRAQWTEEARATYPQLLCSREHPDLYAKILAALAEAPGR